MAGIKRYFQVDNKEQVEAKRKAREAKEDQIFALAAAFFNSSKYQDRVLVTLTNKQTNEVVDTFLGDREQAENDYYAYYDASEICWNPDDVSTPCVDCTEGNPCDSQRELNDFELEINDDKADMGLYLIECKKKKKEPATSSWLLQRFKDEKGDVGSDEGDEGDEEMT